MSSPAGMTPGFLPWQSQPPRPPPMAQNNENNEDGVSVRPMRLKVLYTFDDQNKTNCLARWPHVLNVQTVAMDETTSIGVMELKTCIQAIVQCSPELLSRLGQDYTVYAYDYSEYDNPLVGQGMLSWALAAASPTPGAPAQQSRQLITGRVCKNILGIFSNGVKETLEVKLRLVPVPTMLQSEYQNTMEKYRDTNNSVPSGFDTNEWTSFLQSNPNISQMANKIAPQTNLNMGQRDGMSMEVVNQLLSPQLQQQPLTDPFNQMNAGHQGNDQGNSQGNLTAGAKRKAQSRPSSRASVKKPRRRPSKATAGAGGNTSGYEDATDGDDGPAPKKRAKVTKADKNINTSLAQAPDSLRVAASTAGSLRLFRPIGVASNSQPEAGSHLQEIPRAPTPVPHIPNQHLHRDRAPSQSGLRRDSFVSQVEQNQPRLSPSPPVDLPEDQLRYSIESAGPSPERNLPSPVETFPDIGSSPPFMRTRPPSIIRSSPPCPSSPLLPEMPRTDSGFMSGSLEDLFGEGDEMMDQLNEKEIDLPPHKNNQQVPNTFENAHQDFVMQGTIPGPMESFSKNRPTCDHQKLLSNKKARSAISRAGSVMSEDGQELPPLKTATKKKTNGGRAASRIPTHAEIETSQRKKSQTPTADAQPGRPRSSNSQRPDQQWQQFPPLPAQQHGMDPRFDYSLGVAAPSPPGGQHTPAAQSVAPQQTHFARPPPDQTLPPQPVPRAASQPAQEAAPKPAPQSRPGSRMLVRTASMGSLTLPTIPASDPVLPPSSLHRSQTWSEAPHPVTEAPMPDMNLKRDMSFTPNVPKLPSKPIPVPLNHAMLAKKASIRDKLEKAIANGEMPPFCSNCGAIETSTWRKAWSQEKQGEPGYYEYSDEPGRVTAIIVLTRDAVGKPTSFQLIKKSLLKEENQDDYNEFLLCNPCGIWMSKYKAQRPESKWEINSLNKPRNRDGEKKKPTQRPSKAKNAQNMNLAIPTSEANFRPSDAYFPHSDANFPPSEAYHPQFESMGPPEGVSPMDTTALQQQPIQGSHPQSDVQDRTSMPPQNDSQRGGSIPPRKRLNAMTSEAAPEALRRALRSSPARWAGTQHSPIDLEEQDLGDTRRLIFPSPRKDGSPKVLGEIATNVVTVATTFHSPKERMIDVQDKENCPPTIKGDDVDAELLKLFEEEMGKELARPSTPTGKTPPANPFKTPTRPTPGHRPLTRSVSRSIRSARSAKSPGQLLMFTTTPTRTPGARRSPRHHNGVFESPFTATLNQLMSEANNHTSPARSGMELDFGSLPELPNINNQNQNMDMNFSLEDFFSTDVPMPSSPPRMNFHLYEDPATMNNINWDDFGKFDARDLEKGDDVVVKQEEEDTRRLADDNDSEEHHS